MSKLKTRLTDDFKSAMKNKDITRKNVIQLVRSGVLQKEKDEQIVADDDIVIAVIEKEVKKRKELINEIGDDRPEAKEEAEIEIEILEQYLPEQLTEAELIKVIKDVISKVGASSMKDMGLVMKTTLSEVKGQADGTMVSKIVKDLLS